jgi:hypothetical protein
MSKIPIKTVAHLDEVLEERDNLLKGISTVYRPMIHELTERLAISLRPYLEGEQEEEAVTPVDLFTHGAIAGRGLR